MTLKSVAGFLLAGSLVGQALAGTFPDQPTTLDTTYLTVTYSCPYPQEGSETQIEVDGDTIRVIVTLRGNVCFTGDFPELEYAFELPELPAGDYKLELRHQTDFSAPSFIPPVFQQRFSVIDRVTPRASGLWADETGIGHTASVTFTDDDGGFLTWQTYDTDGEPLWLAGAFSVDGTEIIASAVRSFSGMRYPSLDPNDQRGAIWGTIRMDFRSCDAAILRARSEVAGFRNAAVLMAPLGSVAGLEGCEPDSDAIVTLE